MISDMQELRGAQKRLAACKYILVVALCFGILGLFFNIKFGLFIFAALIALWGVSTYIAYMHYQTIKNRHK